MLRLRFIRESLSITFYNLVKNFQSGITSSESHIPYNHPEEIMRVHRTLDNLGGGYLLKRAMNFDSLGGGYILKKRASYPSSFDSLGGGYLL